MTDFHELLASLRRPRLLIRAARFGLQDYCRDRDLRRLIRNEPPAASEKILPRLMDEEEMLEDRRRQGDAGYSVTRHVEILVAILGEVSLIRRETTPSV